MHVSLQQRMRLLVRQYCPRTADGSKLPASDGPLRSLCQSCAIPGQTLNYMRVPDSRHGPQALQ